MLWLDLFCRSFVEDAFVWVVQEWVFSTESRICMACLEIVDTIQGPSDFTVYSRNETTYHTAVPGEQPVVQ